MPIGTLTSKGQVTIPKEVRERLHLQPGDRIEFRTEEDGSVTLRPVGLSGRELFGFLARPRDRYPSVEEMDESLTSAVAEEAEGESGDGSR